MSKEDFLHKLREQIYIWKELRISPEEVFFYPSGFAPDKKMDLELIRGANRRYHHKESDILISDMLIIKPTTASGIETICRFDMDEMYKEFKLRGWDGVKAIIKQNLETGRSLAYNSFLKGISEYEQVKHDLIIRPLNFPDNQKALKDCIYKQVGDIALVLYGLISEKDGDLGTFKIGYKYLNMWGKNMEEVFDAALENTCRRMPPRMYMFPDELAAYSHNQVDFMSETWNGHIHGMDCPIITTSKRINGAIAMFYPGVQERLSQIVKGNYYIAFTSIHEARLHPEGILKPKTILQSLLNVNEHFDPQEILSRKVYYYDSEEKTFSICAG